MADIPRKKFAPTPSTHAETAAPTPLRRALRTPLALPTLALVQVALAAVACGRGGVDDRLVAQPDPAAHAQVERPVVSRSDDRAARPALVDEPKTALDLQAVGIAAPASSPRAMGSVAPVLAITPTPASSGAAIAPPPGAGPAAITTSYPRVAGTAAAVLPASRGSAKPPATLAEAMASGGHG